MRDQDKETIEKGEWGDCFVPEQIEYLLHPSRGQNSLLIVENCNVCKKLTLA